MPFTEKLLVILRDGRKLIGILRSFDQFGITISILTPMIVSVAVSEVFTGNFSVFPFSSKCGPWRCSWKNNSRRPILWSAFGTLYYPWGECGAYWWTGMPVLHLFLLKIFGSKCHKFQGLWVNVTHFILEKINI